MNLDVVLKHHIGIQRWSEKSTGGNSADFANSGNSPLRRQMDSRLLKRQHYGLELETAISIYVYPSKDMEPMQLHICVCACAYMHKCMHGL